MTSLSRGNWPARAAGVGAALAVLVALAIAGCGG